MRFTWLIPLVILIGGHIESDTRYDLAPTRDIFLGGASLALFGASLFVHGESGSTAPIDDINRPDALLVLPYSHGADNLGTVGAYTALLIPPAALAFSNHRLRDLLTYLVMYSEAFLLTFGTKDILKAFIVRHRPYAYVGPVPDGESDDYFNSFPSGHTAFAFLAATFLAATYRTDHRHSRLRKPLVIAGYTIASATGAARVLSGNHFITDVIAGGMIGSFYGWIVPRLHL